MQAAITYTTDILDIGVRYWGVTLAQLVKAYVGQADVQRFEPRLGHNYLSCGVFLVRGGPFDTWGGYGFSFRIKLFF